MADHETVKIVDEEKQQPLLGSAPEQVKSGAGKRTVSSTDMFTRVVLVVLLILNFAQWLHSMKGNDASKTDEKQIVVLQLQDQVRDLCLERAALLKAVESTNKVAGLPSNPGHGSLYNLENFLSTTTIENEAVSEAFEMVKNVLAQQNELLNERATQQVVTNPHLSSVCKALAI